MTIIIHNTTVITADAGRRVLYDSAVVIDGDRIVDVGPSSKIISKYPRAERIDGRGKAVMPGFANCHTHLTATLNRGIEEDFGFPTTLRYPKGISEYVTDEEFAVMAQLGVLESIRSGVTTLHEIGSVEEYGQAMVDSGLRFMFGIGASDVDPSKVFMRMSKEKSVFEFDEARGEASLRHVKSIHSKFDGMENDRIRVSCAAPMPERCSPWMLRQIRELSMEWGRPSSIHLNQSWWEVEAVKNTRGVLPSEYLFQNDFLWPGLIVGHCRCMDTREVQLVGRSGAPVCFISAIAARRGMSPPIAELEALGSPIVMGSDNMAYDMIEVMRTGLFMERVRLLDGMHPTPEDVLQWATANGHRALGFTDCGTIEVGKKADLIVVNTQRAHLVPTMRIVSAFVHNGLPSDVESVMVDGKWVMRDGEVLTMDEASIIREAERIGRRAWKCRLEEYPDVPLPVRLDTSEPS
jgi:cytosine/adenosine deaminase-related metal-dependent hydrolase